MAQELDPKMFTEQAVSETLAHPDSELQDVVKTALDSAFKDSEVQAAFKAMFTPEELQALAEIPAADLAAALGAALGEDEELKKALNADLGDWAKDIEITVPADAAGLDELISQWQIPTE